MLMIIAGLVQPDSGEVWIGGRLSTFAAPHRRDIGLVFQNYALFPHLSVYENIAFPLRMRRVSEKKIAGEVSRVLEAVRLPGVQERMVHELSGGQQQRIALARCIIYQPSIILMDEPLGALDKKLREQLQLEIRHLHQELGITILYVTHDQQEALFLSDRICLMNDSRIEQIGRPSDLYFQPATPFAADFIGESNIFEVTVLEVAGAATVKGPGDAVLRAATDRRVVCGQRLKAMVRPERVTVLREAEAPANVVTGIVDEVIFLGDVTKYFVRVAEDLVFCAKSLTRDSIDSPRAGATVRLGWDVDSMVLLS